MPRTLAPLLLALLLAPPPSHAKPRPKDAADVAPQVVRLATPASRGSMAPRLSREPGGTPILSWVEPSETGHGLLYSRLGPEGWGKPAVAATGSDWFVNWADTPGVTAAADGTLWAHWLVRSGEARYAYDAVVSSSGDGGATWTPPRRLHDDPSAAEHGFVSMTSMGDEVVAMWLDGRAQPAGGAMSVRARTLRGDGFGAEALLDPRSCDCCPTSIAATKGGLVAAWRDRSAEEVRDIAVSRFIDGAWEPPRVVSRDNWRMPGCPVNGPTVVANQEFVALVWYTGVGEEGSVRFAVSNDAGESFGQVESLSRSTLGRVTGAALPAGGAALAWLEQRQGGDPWLTVARIDADGAVRERVPVAPMDSARRSGMPRAIHVGGGVILLTWTDLVGDSTRIRTAQVGPLTR